MMIADAPLFLSSTIFYYNGVDVNVLKELADLQSLEYVLDLYVCYTELKIIVEKTPAETCIDKFCTTHVTALHTGNSKLHFLVWVSPNATTGSFRRSFVPSSRRGDSRVTTFQCTMPATRKYFSR